MIDTTKYLDECGYRIDEFEYLDSWGWCEFNEEQRFKQGQPTSEELGILITKYYANEDLVELNNDYLSYFAILSLPITLISKNKTIYTFVSAVVDDCEKNIQVTKKEIDTIYRVVPNMSTQTDTLLQSYILDKHLFIKQNEYVIEKFSFYKTVASPWRKKDVKVIDTSMAKAATIQEILGISKQHGDRQFIPCPIHKESTPSCCIYTKQNSWHCYGCGAGGDGIDLVQKLHSLSFPEALKFITDTYG